MTAIAVGPAVTNRAAVAPAAYTSLDLANPADGTGTIDTVTIWAAVSMTDLKVGMFYLTTGTSYKCRSIATIGAVTAGSLQTFSGLSFAVTSGDCIGAYWTGLGSLERDDTGGSSAFVSGDYCTVGAETSYTAGTRIYSMHGAGTTGGGVVAPTVTTQAASSVTSTTATLNGTIVNAGGENCTIRGFKYGITSGALDLDVHEDGSFAAGAFSLPITGL